MEQEVQKNSLNNESYRERFQFILSLDENIICQRYFRINGFNIDSIESCELKDTIDDIVDLIRADLEYKSRVYQWYTRDEPIKLTGFTGGSDATYYRYPDDMKDTYVDASRPAPYEYVFKFVFLMDGKVIYEKIWDGGEYPRYVRNSVDLTNSDASYKGRDPLTLPFNTALTRAMTIDKSDLIYTIIRKICDVASSTYTEKYGQYTKKDKYGEKKYRYSLYNEEFVRGWREQTLNKTKEYFSKLYPSQRQIERIEKFM